ncbi:MULTISPECIES: hypothetical protein [Dictyoglomus]|jgi:hypothetical protein|uniref:LTXXQ motif family protein n=1 Tax=Dictyoglomus turgidum (strain DSM 6724 / Z-1310) TaxID=515635 RepID=B8E038_DICTD|nr:MULTISPECIES: hypothetical protein [Dictyoglomus]ACK42121.1 conserved hypothetical protein [Dictyoglomus turgidum DSM 6724]HBU32352.1 hypothetical protein [Dictyoglomus sp.]
MRRIKAVLGLVFIILFFVSVVNAQTTQTQTPRRGFMSQEVQYLTRLIRDLRELDKDKKVAITKDQARKLISILQELGKMSELPKKEADKFISRIEGTLTDAQLTYLDKLQIERQKRIEEMRQKMSQQQSSSQQPQFNPQLRNQQNFQMSERERQEFQKFMDAWSKGKPLNPFYHLSIYKKQLNDLIDYLKKK